MFIGSFTKLFDCFISHFNFVIESLSSALLYTPILDYLFKFRVYLDHLLLQSVDLVDLLFNKFGRSVMALPNVVCKLERLGCVLRKHLHFLGNQIVEAEATVFDGC